MLAIKKIWDDLEVGKCISKYTEDKKANFNIIKESYDYIIAMKKIRIGKLEDLICLPKSAPVNGSRVS